MKTEKVKDRLLEGRTLWIPRMSYSSARFFAAVFRSVGINSSASPESDERTLELGGLHMSGEECYPQKITLGNFLRVLEENGPDKTAFFLPTANGPCRFGQYSPYLKLLLEEMGHPEVPVFSPSSENGYDGLGAYTDKPAELIRAFWRAVVCADIIRKRLLQVRPYEVNAGTTDRVYEESMQVVEDVLEIPGMSQKQRLVALVDAMCRIRNMFRDVEARYTRGRPLIGVVGEIFCRLNTFSNFEAIRKIEKHGGECWLSDISEWVWYTNWSHTELLKRDGKKISLSMAGALVKHHFQKSDETALLDPFEEDFVGYEEPHDVYQEVLKPVWSYLPADGALGEMVLSVGKSVYLHNKGADGIIDISPFSCMNGTVTESVYHQISEDYNHIPIRNFYFDDSSSNLERDLDIFMELACNYRDRKTIGRTYPSCFEAGA